MKKRLPEFLFLFTITVLILLPNFYRNRWQAVETTYYNEWQTRYDRLVVARLVKTRMDGFFSAGGLMGLGDTDQWGFTTRLNRTQFNTYLDKGEFQSYLIYKSNPGIQAVGYGLFDRVSPFPGELNLKFLRGFTALLSAAVFALMLTALTLEFGILPGFLTLLFTLFSMWIVLPAGSIFWDLWAFYLPFLASVCLLWNAGRTHEYPSRQVHTVLFLAMLAKILFSGFDISTTVIIMATVPFIFFGIYHNWDLKTFSVRLLKAGLSLCAASLTGLVILSAQIIASEGTFRSAYDYILNRVGSHAAGNYEYFTNEAVEVRSIHVLEVLPKYLVMPAVDLQHTGYPIRILYWQLIVLFFLFTLVYLLRHRWTGIPPKGLALLVTTWYSILAPLSWYVLFRPHSFIHTHVNTMGWQMPFTLMGFTLCGYILTDFFTGGQRALVRIPPSTSSQSG